jgi:hypothetical protein
MAMKHFMAPVGTRARGKARMEGLWITFAVAMAAVAGAVMIVAMPQPLASTMPVPSSPAHAGGAQLVYQHSGPGLVRIEKEPLQYRVASAARGASCASREK